MEAGRPTAHLTQRVAGRGLSYRELGPRPGGEAGTVCCRKRCPAPRRTLGSALAFAPSWSSCSVRLERCRPAARPPPSPRSETLPTPAAQPMPSAPVIGNKAPARLRIADAGGLPALMLLHGLPVFSTAGASSDLCASVRLSVSVSWPRCASRLSAASPSSTRAAWCWRVESTSCRRRTRGSPRGVPSLQRHALSATRSKSAAARSQTWDHTHHHRNQ
jgi:hypothetical protein